MAQQVTAYTESDLTFFCDTAHREGRVDGWKAGYAAAEQRLHDEFEKCSTAIDMANGCRRKYRKIEIIASLGVFGCFLLLLTSLYLYGCIKAPGMAPAWARSANCSAGTF